MLIEAGADVCKVQLARKALPTWLRGCAAASRSLTLTATPSSLWALQHTVWIALKLDAVNDLIIIDTRTDACPGVLSGTAACALRDGDTIVVQPVWWLIGISNSDDQCVEELQQLRAAGIWFGPAELETSVRKVKRLFRVD